MQTNDFGAKDPGTIDSNDEGTDDNALGVVDEEDKDVEDADEVNEVDNAKRYSSLIVEQSRLPMNFSLLSLEQTFLTYKQLLQSTKIV